MRLILTAKVIEDIARRIIDAYGHIPGRRSVGVFPTEDDPPQWINIYTTAPTMRLIEAELRRYGIVVESREQY